LAFASSANDSPQETNDGIVVHVRGPNGWLLAQTTDVMLGMNIKERKEHMGLWLSETEGAEFWLSCLTDLKNRGLKDRFVACTEGLSGFAEALYTAYPEARVRLCIVHKMRAAFKYVGDEDRDAVVAEVKKSYEAATVLEAEHALEAVAESWDDNIRRSQSTGD
jgi:transposase-like protein